MRTKMKNPSGVSTQVTIRRILAYLKNDRGKMILALLMSAVASLATVAGTFMLRGVINDHIIPLIGQTSPDFKPLISVLTRMGAIYLGGVCAAYFSSLIMVYVSSGDAAAAADRYVYQG